MSGSQLGLCLIHCWLSFSVRSVFQMQSDSASVVYYFVDSIKCILKPGYGRTAPCLESLPEMKNFSPKGHGLGHVTQGIFQDLEHGGVHQPLGVASSGVWGRAPAEIEFGAFSLKIRHLMATVLVILATIKRQNVVQFGLESTQVNIHVSIP